MVALPLFGSLCVEEPGLAGAGLLIGDDLFTGLHNAVISKIEISDGTVL